jgi:predicted cupin superfamily sugar epimerase
MNEKIPSQPAGAEASPGAEELIRILGMTPHPEGGFYASTYVSDGKISGGSSLGFSGDRNFSTAIYYLLRNGEKSYLHRLRQDEIWHYYRGDPLEIVSITPDGKLFNAAVGANVETGEKPQYVVRGGIWFAAVSRGCAGYSLVGCTVSPGFSDDDFELAEASEMRKLFPSANLEEIIAEFCLEPEATK